MGLTPFPSQQATIARLPFLLTPFRLLLFVLTPHSALRNPH
jgi:hypothetical protein